MEKRQSCQTGEISKHVDPRTLSEGARSHMACERREQTYTCTLMFHNLMATTMATDRKMELTAHRLRVLEYILHGVESCGDGASGIYLTPRERVSESSFSLTGYHVSWGSSGQEIKQKPLLWGMEADAGCMEWVCNNVGRQGGSAPTGLAPLPTPDNSRLWQIRKIWRQSNNAADIHKASWRQRNWVAETKP